MAIFKKKMSSGNIRKLPQIDYRDILKFLKIPFQEDDYYVRVGIPAVTQGWILHISVILQNGRELIETVAPVLYESKVPFKIIKNSALHRKINDGDFGKNKVGKVVTVFLDDQEAIEPLVRELIGLTRKFDGPKVFTDLPIRNVLFTRYGSFVSMIGTDSVGNKVRLMRDKDQNLIVDDYYAPPIVPTWVSNPFIPFIEIRSRKSKFRIIESRAIITRLVKADVKGDVWRGIYITSLLIPKLCIIKQGRSGIFPDDSERDARDRLRWQYQLNKVLKNKIRTPEIWDCFEVGKSTYVPIKYVKGKNLYEEIWSVLRQNTWASLDVKIKLKMMGYLLQIALYIREIHKCGYIHRDISASNFVVGRRQKIWLIDLELMYSDKEGIPDPPFRTGTPGYMSPEQNRGERPTYSDDSYSIGALICVIISGGLEPLSFIENETTSIKRRVSLFSGSIELTNLVLACLDKDPECRPTVEDIYARLTKYDVYLKEHTSGEGSQYDDDLTHQIDKVLRDSVVSLSGNLMAKDGVWFSKIDNNYDWEIYPMLNKHHFGGIYKGVGGVILFLLKLREFGVDIQKASMNMQKSIDFLKSYIFCDIENWNPSFYYGRAGFGLIMNGLMEENLVDANDFSQGILLKCFQERSNELNILRGVAGQGMSLLQCYQFRNHMERKGLLESYVDLLVNMQQKDGSWISSSNSEKDTSFGYGIAGIVYFLLSYGFQEGNGLIINSAERGLRYLIENKRTMNNFTFWTLNGTSKVVGRWWCNGGPGIALTFLKAYEFLCKPEYLGIAESALLFHPKNIVIPDLSQCHGLSGLGEIYLEALRLSNNNEWLERATWIAEVLISLKRTDGKGGAYWPASDIEVPTADFMIGNSGILHFLLRYLHREEIGFPLLSLSKGRMIDTREIDENYSSLFRR